MADGWHLRGAIAADAARLGPLIDAAYEGYRNRGIALPDVSGGIAEDIRDRVVLVAEGATGILGVAVAEISSAAAHLMNVAVAPNAAGQGVGKGLMAEVERRARALGAPALKLATHQDIPENVALYQHLGFSVTGQEGARIFMEKPLSW